MRPGPRAGLALLLLGGCASGQAAAPAPVASGGAPLLSPDPEATRAEIRALVADSEASLARLGIDVEAPMAPSSPMPMADVAPTFDELRGTCAAAPTDETCGDVCRLGEHVCASGERICGLAAQLPGDAWAAERCTAARDACALAEQRCCACA